MTSTDTPTGTTSLDFTDMECLPAAPPKLTRDYISSLRCYHGLAPVERATREQSGDVYACMLKESCGFWHNAAAGIALYQVDCDCGKPMKERAVTKDGPTHGKRFRLCAQDPQCARKFEWVDPDTASTDSRVLSASIRCIYHKEPAVELTVKKDGEHTGKTFYACARRDEADRCKFFKWDATYQAELDARRPIDAKTVCYCDRPSVIGLVRRATRNQGRSYRACADSKCTFFKWCSKMERPKTDVDAARAAIYNSI